MSRKQFAFTNHTDFFLFARTTLPRPVSSLVSSNVTNLARTSPIRQLFLFLYTWSADCSAPLVQIVNHETWSPGSYFRCLLSLINIMWILLHILRTMAYYLDTEICRSDWYKGIFPTRSDRLPTLSHTGCSLLSLFAAPICRNLPTGIIPALFWFE